MATMKQLVESEISDFFAIFGSPGEPVTIEEAQKTLLSRISPLLSTEWQGVCGPTGKWQWVFQIEGIEHDDVRIEEWLPYPSPSA